MSSFWSVVNHPAVIYSLKPKIPFINEYPTIEATSLLTIHFKLLDLRTCRLSVHLINRTTGPSLFPLRLLHLFFLLATSLSLSAAAATELRHRSSAGRCINLVVPENCGAPLLLHPLWVLSLSPFVDLLKVHSFFAVYQSSSGLQYGSVPPHLWI